MKRIITAILSVVLLLLMCSCGKNTSVSSNNQKNEPSVQEQTATVNACFLEQSAYDEYHEYNHSDSEYAIKIIFDTNKSVTDFKYLSLDTQAFANDGTYKIDTIIYSLETLTPQKPVVIGMEFPGTMPSNAVCFTNTDGKTEYYYLNLSGKDGSLVFERFEPNSKAF